LVCVGTKEFCYFLEFFGWDRSRTEATLSSQAFAYSFTHLISTSRKPYKQTWLILTKSFTIITNKTAYVDKQNKLTRVLDEVGKSFNELRG